MKLKHILMATAMSLLAGTAGAQDRVTYKSAKSTSSYYQMGVQIAEAMKAGTEGGIIVTVEESQGSVQNVMEVKARGGELFVFADADSGFRDEDGTTVLNVPHVDDLLAPIVYAVPLQLLAYHVAVHKGTDVDQPRNLAKSVTVE